MIDKSLSLTLIEDFETLTHGDLPDKGWESRNGSPKGSYKIDLEGSNHYLAAKDTGRSIQVFRKGGWDIAKEPWLKWSWRVKEFPKGADESNPKKNDSAAAIYVVFPRRFFVPEAIKYVWSQVVASETILMKSKKFPAIVVRTGTEMKEKWVDELRNVAEDYKKLFGRNPPDPVAIGFLTDADAVKGSAKADYDNVRVDAKK